jgi:hypothetical protein
VRKKGHLEIQYNKWKWSEDWWIVSGDGKGHEVNWGFGTVMSPIKKTKKTYRVQTSDNYLLGIVGKLNV